MSGDYLEDVFGPAGLLAKAFAGYAPRPGQVLLARAVDQAMRGTTHLLAEGPCGTGKSLAYGVPAVWHAHHHQKRVLIVTANIALQEQLVTKDLPLLRRLLPWPFTFALLKGRSHYLCRERLQQTTVGGTFAGFTKTTLDTQIRKVAKWASRTETGDASELPFLAEPRVWARFSVGHDDCKGGGCAQRTHCFANKARKAAAAANIIVTNYHLLFANLALRRETGRDVLLPPYHLLVLDEAQEAADAARGFFGYQLAERAVTRLARDADALGGRPLAPRLRRSAETFFRALPAAAKKASAPDHRLQTPGWISADEVLSGLEEIADRAQGVLDSRESAPAARSKAQAAKRKARTLHARFRDAVQLGDPNMVYWLETDKKGVHRVQAKPLDVGGDLGPELFPVGVGTVLVSATMTTSGTFDFIRSELGVPPAAAEVVAPSPFDFGRQALLLLPPGIPDPREEGHLEAIAAQYRDVITACEGRTLGLFTSYQALNAVYERVKGGPHRILRQGERGRTELARTFREETSSVLFGTESFWTGIDVPGEALTAVVIDKLPFPNVSDPWVAGLAARHPDAFQRHFLPRTIMLLRQGVGRLIRATTDVGVVVLLDPRLQTKAYGRGVLASLPKMRRATAVAAIKPFLDAARASSSATAAALLPGAGDGLQHVVAGAVVGLAAASSRP